MNYPCVKACIALNARTDEEGEEATLLVKYIQIMIKVVLDGTNKFEYYLESFLVKQIYSDMH